MLRTLTAILTILAVSTVVAQSDDRSTALKAFFAELGAAAEAGDREGYEGAFNSDAVMFLPHRPPLLGQESIGDWFDIFTKQLELQIDSYEQQQIDIIGDVAMVRSHATGHFRNKKSGERLPFDQKYLDVLRFEDGRWRLAYHVASSNSSAPGLWESDWEAH